MEKVGLRPGSRGAATASGGSQAVHTLTAVYTRGVQHRQDRCRQVHGVGRCMPHGASADWVVACGPASSHARMCDGPAPSCRGLLPYIYLSTYTYALRISHTQAIEVPTYICIVCGMYNVCVHAGAVYKARSARDTYLCRRETACRAAAGTPRSAARSCTPAVRTAKRCMQYMRGSVM